MLLNGEDRIQGPYPGLRSFQEYESPIFFGRDQQIDEILERLKRHRFLAIVGSSGCGKSSLVRAGVLPALRSGLMGELGSDWLIAEMKPGDHPLTNLAGALLDSQILGEHWSPTVEGKSQSQAQLTAELRRSDVSLVRLIQKQQLPKFKNLLLLVDQYEEIFRFHQQDPNEATTFVQLLLETAHDRTVPVYILLTMRTDFLGECALFTGLPEVLNESLYLCPRLTRDQLTQAIVNPAAMFEGSVAPELVRQIIREASTNPDQLPLVQHALARLWDKNHQKVISSKVLELQDYLNLGGLCSDIPMTATTGSLQNELNLTTQFFLDNIKNLDLTQPKVAPSTINTEIISLEFATGNALSQHCDIAYMELHDHSPESQTLLAPHIPSRLQKICRSMFCSLTEYGSSGKIVRHPRTVRNLAAIAGCTFHEVCSVAEVFRREGRNFLTPSSEVKLTYETVLDISHEALIRQWTRLGADESTSVEGIQTSSWLSIEQTSRRNYRRIFEAATNESTAGLLQTPELEHLKLWWSESRPTPAWAHMIHPNSHNKTEGFLSRSMSASKKLHNQKKQEEEKQIWSKATKTISRTWVKALTITIVVGLPCIIGSTTNQVRGVQTRVYPMSANLARCRA